jgi:flavin reductase (DIM6/NTAB) family NADH-FMN oxidoreductase RutF
VIDANVKRALGQMIKGVQIVATTHDGVTRAFTSHWVTQVAFEEPIVMASVSPKHDTHALLAASGWFTVSVCAADQLEAAQYFSYPGRRFRYIATEMLTTTPAGFPVLDGCIAWVRAEVFQRLTMADHDLFFARVTHHGYGRLREPPLAYSSRHGWRIAGERARARGVSIRDRLLERLAAAGYDTTGDGSDNDDDDDTEGD